MDGPEDPVDLLASYAAHPLLWPVLRSALPNLVPDGPLPEGFLVVSGADLSIKRAGLAQRPHHRTQLCNCTVLVTTGHVSTQAAPSLQTGFGCRHLFHRVQ